MKMVLVSAVALIDRDGRVLLAKRPKGKSMEGLWEFPGGKVESGESVFDALKRELHEEVALTINSSSELMVIEHDYGDKCVKLDVHLVTDFSGDAHGAEGQKSAWVAIDKLDEYNFPAANVDIINKIKSLG